MNSKRFSTKEIVNKLWKVVMDRFAQQMLRPMIASTRTFSETTKYSWIQTYLITQWSPPRPMPCEAFPPAGSPLGRISPAGCDA